MGSEEEAIEWALRMPDPNGYGEGEIELPPITNKGEWHMNQEVTDFIDTVKETWQKEVCSSLRGVVHEAIPDTLERMQYKKPHFLKNGKYAAVISTSKDAVSFTIFNATELTLPDGLFEGPPERKTIKFKQGQSVDLELLSTLVGQASSKI